MQWWMMLVRRHPAAAVRRLAILAGLGLATSLLAAAPALADDRPDGAELATAAGMLIVMMAFFVAAALAIVWARRNGEFAEPEEVKYHMLALAEDEPDYWDIGTREDDDEIDKLSGQGRGGQASPRQLASGTR